MTMFDDPDLLRVLTQHTYSAPRVERVSLADVVNSVQCMDAIDLLRRLPDSCVDCVVTSPPYYGLRSYLPAGHPDKETEIGLEDTPQAYVDRLVRLFREARRVLKDSGTLWLNLGDSYSSDVGGKCDLSRGQLNKHRQSKGYEYHIQSNRNGQSGLPAKNLIGIPWRAALALQADGWYLRSDIIWSKPNPMPESVKDRPTKAHEYVFLLSKNERYFYDADAIKEQITESSKQRALYGWNGTTDDNSNGARTGSAFKRAAQTGENLTTIPADGMRNKRTVWEIPPEPSPYPHFAMWPQKLAEPMILAGCPVGGVVLDPFGGSGTTGLVARRLGRDYILCDLSPEYCDLARQRLAQGYTLPMLSMFGGQP